jgi:adenylate kinase family enzyme
LKKIFIVGSVASGKTTLAKNLSKKRNIPWYELDQVVHNRQNIVQTKRSDEEQRAIIEEIDAKNSMWIFEGTDRKSYQCLYEMADTILFLDPPLWIRKKRIVTRLLKQLLKLEKSHYKPDIQMLKLMFIWTKDFEKNRNEIEKKLDAYKTKLIRIRNQKSLQHVLNLSHYSRRAL